MGVELEVPARLDWMRRVPAGREWLASLPARLAACVDRWGLRLGPTYDGGVVSLTLRADLPDGTPGVLKLQYPDPDSEHEAAALTAWAGDGAVRLLAHEPQWRALLVERCVPGEPLHRLSPGDALGVAVDRRRCGTGWTGSPASWGWTGTGSGAGRSARHWPGASVRGTSSRSRSRWSAGCSTGGDRRPRCGERRPAGFSPPGICRLPGGQGRLRGQPDWQAAHQ